MSFFPYLRSLISSLLFVVHTLIFSSMMLVPGLLKWRGGQNWILKTWGQISLLLFGVSIEVTMESELPQKHGVLFVFNHQSHFDIPVLCTAFPKPFRFGAKIELFKIPIFGHAMRACGVLPIARQNRREVFRVYQEAESRFANNESFALAPEGTRQTEPKIGEFKKGPFIFAINAKAPIVPIVLVGAYDLLPKYRLLVNRDRWRRTVRVHVGPVFATDGLTNEQVEHLRDEIRAYYVRVYDEMVRGTGQSTATTELKA